jgi:lactoylglutathione lyase/methylmalonyl-CoA/ethylmalonyl-CoA epimerase
MTMANESPAEKAVLRVLCGEAEVSVARSLNVPVATLREWREQFVAAGRTALASTPVPSRSTRRLHHVGIIVPSEHRIGQLMGILGLEEWYRGEVPQWQATCVFARVGHGLAVEFVLPNGGVLSQFNQGQGGLHHFALAVDNLAQTTEELESKGVSLLERAPQQGAGPFICNFIPRIYTRGVLVELVEMLI